MLTITGCAVTDNAYFKVGAGLKLDEPKIMFDDGSTPHPISARLELGSSYGPIYYGISHHSQWATGFPFGDEMEPGKTEIFIDYEFKFND